MRRIGLAALAVVGHHGDRIRRGRLGGYVADAQRGGTVIFSAEQEPPCLNGALDGCNNTWTSWTWARSLRALYIIKPNFSIVPDMSDGRSEGRRTGGKFTLTIKIKKKAVWNDGIADHREGLRLHDAGIPRSEERGRGPQRLGLDRERQAAVQGRQDVPCRLREALCTVEGAAGDEPVSAARTAGNGLQHGLERRTTTTPRTESRRERTVHHVELHEGSVDDVDAEPEVVGAAPAVPRQGRLRLPDEHRIRRSRRSVAARWMRSTRSHSFSWSISRASLASRSSPMRARRLEHFDHNVQLKGGYPAHACAMGPAGGPTP